MLYLPGEIEHDTFKRRSEGGIPYSQAVVDQLNTLADEFGIERFS